MGTLLSIVIPAWSGSPLLADMALNLAKQVKPMGDELIISEDGDYYPELEAIADIYLRHPRVGHMQNMNIGFRASSGKFVSFLDSDIVIMDGNLRDLCMPGKLVCGKWRELREYTSFRAWCCVVDRTILENPEYAIPDVTGREGLDGWGEHLIKNGSFEWSDKIEYSHMRARSYSELSRQRRLESDQKPTREIADDRHKARLSEDPAYAELFNDT